MTRVSVLQQLYVKQSRAKYRFLFIGMLLGILTGGIPLAVFANMYVTSMKTITSSTTIPTSAVRWNSSGITVAGVTGVPGTGSNQLNTPYDVVLDYMSNLYIADRNNNRTQKYPRGVLNGLTVAGQQNGTPSTSSDGLRIPYGVEVNSNGGIYIADAQNNRVQFWSEGATIGTTVAGNANGTGGNSTSSLQNPCGVELDQNTNTLYVADNFNYRIMAYASGASFGTVVAGGNGPGLNNTQLSKPMGIHYDSITNSLIISNTDTNNVVQWTIGANHWVLLAGSYSNTIGNTSSLFNGVRGITMDPMGNLYVADALNHRIQLFMSGQTDGITIAGTSGVSGSNATLFNRPYSVALDSQLNLYVADAFNHRVQKFLRY